MPMSSLDITFFSAPDGVSNADHYKTCMEKTRSMLESVGVITLEHPEALELQMECPTDHVKDVVKALMSGHRMGIVKVVPIETVHRKELGGEGG